MRLSLRVPVLEPPVERTSFLSLKSKKRGCPGRRRGNRALSRRPGEEDPVGGWGGRGAPREEREAPRLERDPRKEEGSPYPFGAIGAPEFWRGHPGRRRGDRTNRDRGRRYDPDLVGATLRGRRRRVAPVSDAREEERHPHRFGAFAPEFGARFPGRRRGTAPECRRPREEEGPKQLVGTWPQGGGSGGFLARSAQGGGGAVVSVPDPKVRGIRQASRP